jgi:hypothetical protein
MAGKTIPSPGIPDERLELLNTVARRDHVSADQLWRWKHVHGLEPRSIKQPGRSGRRLTCTSWFREFLLLVDEHSRRQLGSPGRPIKGRARS